MNLKLMKRAVGYAGKKKILIFLALLSCAIYTATALMAPGLSGGIADQLAAGAGTGFPIDLRGICVSTGILILLFFINVVFDVLQRSLMANVSSCIVGSLRDKLNEKVDRLPMDYFFSKAPGDILSCIVNDTDVIGQHLSQTMVNVFSGLVMVTADLAIMFLTNFHLALICIIVNIAGTALIAVVASFSSGQYYRQAMTTGQLNAYIGENFSGHSVVTAYNHQAASAKVFKGISEVLKDSSFKAQGFSGISIPMSVFTSYFSTLFIFISGIRMAMTGECTIGVIIAFIMYSSRLSQPLTQITQSIQPLTSMDAALKRIFALMDEEEIELEANKKNPPEKPQGNIVFEHVKFGYDPFKMIIKDFSLEVKSGMKVAIVGPTGAGKTTLVNLLMRFYEINGGNIYFDGVNYKDYSREAVRNMFSMVLQESWVFTGTLRENLTFGTRNVSEEKLDEAVKAVGLDYYISTLPKGYETILDSRLSLSQGQKQQITIARAMIADRPMVILDEATSSIDTRTEKLIQDAMDKLMAGRTSFVIAHRLSTIVNADLILVLKDGDIIESGRHDELMAQNGFYAELYDSQFHVS